MTEPEYYMPSNGTDGAIFMDEWCENCQKDTGLRGGKTYCSILTNSMIKDKVKQWVYIEGIPTCTSFVKMGTKKQFHKELNIKNQIELL